MTCYEDFKACSVNSTVFLSGTNLHFARTKCCNTLTLHGGIDPLGGFGGNNIATLQPRSLMCCIQARLGSVHIPRISVTASIASFHSHNM